MQSSNASAAAGNDRNSSKKPMAKPSAARRKVGALGARIGSKDYTEIPLPGGHVGLFVSRSRAVPLWRVLAVGLQLMFVWADSGRSACSPHSPSRRRRSKQQSNSSITTDDESGGANQHCRFLQSSGSAMRTTTTRTITATGTGDRARSASRFAVSRVSVGCCRRPPIN